jgi:hypothetical protein
VWYALQPLPVPRPGLFSSAVCDTIYVMGGGSVPGASYSNLNHAYQNNSISEVNYMDFRNTLGEIIEVGCSSGLRASGNYNFGGDFLQSLKCNLVVTLILVFVIIGIIVGIIFIVWRKRK